MSPEQVLAALEQLADQLEIPVAYAAIATEELPGRGGLCVLFGERRIIVEQGLGAEEKVRLLATGLGEFDLENVYIPPQVRDAIDRARSHSPS